MGDGGVASLMSEELGAPFWEYVTETDGCVLYRRMNEEADNSSGIRTVRVQIPFPVPAKRVFDFVWDLSNRRKFDSLVTDLQVVVDIKDELVEPVKACDVLYASFSMPFPISSRDFVHVRYV